MFNSSIFGNRVGVGAARGPYVQLSGGGGHGGGHGGGGHGGHGGHGGGGHHGGGGFRRSGGSIGPGWGYDYGPTYIVDEDCPPGTIMLEDGTCVIGVVR